MHDALKFYGDRIAGVLSPKSMNDVNVVTKGLVLYRQGMVTKLQIEDELIHGVVQDVMKVDVTLDLTFPSNSSCSCPAIDLCRHQLAVFFAAYSKSASVSDWVEEWKNKNNALYGLKKSLESGPVFKETKEKPMNAKPDHNYASWRAFFADVAREELVLPPYFMMGTHRIASSYQRAIQRSEPENRQWIPLYRSMAYFHGMRYLFDQDSESLDHFRKEMLQQSVHELYLALIDEMSRFETSIRPFDSEEFIEAFLEETESLLYVDSFTFYRWQMYVLIWSASLATKEERAAEMRRLESLIPSLAEVEAELAKMMVVHLLMLDGKDEEALQYILSIGPGACYYLTFILEELNDEKQHARMIPFVEFYSKNIKAFLTYSYTQEYKRTNYLYNALQIIRPFSSATKRFDLLERMLRETIPYSLIPYSHYLYEKKDYKKWVELQVAERMNVLFEWPQQTKEIQKENPEVLLPIYHQQVIQLIGSKNRSSYREAVKYLKKLRTIYKKLKRVPVWESYITYISETYKRLRAFQEELRKGKLIDAAD